MINTWFRIILSSFDSVVCFSWQSLKVTYLIPVYLELSECAKNQASSLRSQKSVSEYKELYFNGGRQPFERVRILLVTWNGPKQHSLKCKKNLLAPMTDPSSGRSWRKLGFK